MLTRRLRALRTQPGIYTNSLDPQNRLIYAARITKKLPNGEYYEGDKFTSRHDCIYTPQLGRYVRRGDAKFHDKPSDLTHDLGSHPEYARANVLLSTDFRYLATKVPTSINQGTS